MPADRHLSNVGESGVTQNTLSVYNLSGTAVDATYQTFGDSPATNAEDIWVRLNSEDSDKYEVGLFTFNTGTPNTLTRVETKESSNSDSAVDFASENIEAIASVVPGSEIITRDNIPSILVDSPNGHPLLAELEDTESVEITVVVPDQETLKVYRWGVYRISDGTAPTGLQVQVLDGGDTVQASANTTDNESTDKDNPVASHQNTSGSASVFKLRLDNATGSTENVGGHFAYIVE